MNGFQEIVGRSLKSVQNAKARTGTYPGKLRKLVGCKMAKKSTVPMVPEGQLEIEAFKGKEIRKVLHEDEWYFSIIDVIEAVTDSTRPSKYWTDLKSKLEEEEDFEVSDFIGKLKMPGSDGKLYPTEAANTETVFRIIQSIPSKKAEPFKRWLAKVGYERILEYQNPEIAIKRAIINYRMQGYTDDWIEARVKTIVVRNELTSEWARRNVKEGEEYAILTNVIQQETFGINIQGHKSLKNLKKNHNLRDHMTDMELIFTMLGEKSTTNIAIASDAQGFNENKQAATDGGKVAGDARIALERKTNKRVVSSKNFLPPKGDQKRLDTP